MAKNLMFAITPGILVVSPGALDACRRIGVGKHHPLIRLSVIVRTGEQRGCSAKFSRLHRLSSLFNPSTLIHIRRQSSHLSHLIRTIHRPCRSTQSLRISYFQDIWELHHQYSSRPQRTRDLFTTTRVTFTIRSC